jgi:hypothetical protein
MSTNTERITNLESEVELLKQKLNDSINFINALRVMYEMKHPIHPQSQVVSLASTIVDEEEPSLELTFDEPKSQAVSLASTIVDEEEPSLELTFEETLVDDESEDSLELTFDEPKPQAVSLASTIVDEEEPLEIDQKMERMNETYDDLELLSDNEEYEDDEETYSLIKCETKEDDEEVSEETIIPPPPTPVIIEESVLVIDEDIEDVEDVSSESTCPPPPPTPIIEEPLQNMEAPLPPNLSTSPLPEFVEQPDEIVEEVINYKKTKVTALKKLCKARGFKGYSKLKKQQLIDLLTQ